MLTNTILLQEAAPQGGMSGIIMIVVLIAIFYFFMIRPQQKRQKEIRKFREGLGKGDSIVTAGGIYGTVRSVENNYFLVEIANGVRIRVDKGSVYPSAEEANMAQNEGKDGK